MTTKSAEKLDKFAHERGLTEDDIRIAVQAILAKIDSVGGLEKYLGEVEMPPADSVVNMATESDGDTYEFYHWGPGEISRFNTFFFGHVMPLLDKQFKQ